MKILVTAPYADGTGYSYAAQELIMAMDSVGIDVVCRQIKMTNTSGEVYDKILEFEKKSLNNVDVFIQHNLPSEFVYKSGVVNVGYFDYETSGFPNTKWHEKLSLMDMIFVPCKFQKRVVQKELPGFCDKTFTVPHAVDTLKYERQYKKINFGLPLNCHKFYTISELGKRKNIAALLLAYYSEFSADDNVVLVIKTHIKNNPQETINHIEKISQEIKSSLKRFVSDDRYPRIIVSTNYLTNEQICEIHNSCDTFVIASHGEAYCIPAIDALGFNKMLIVPNFSSFKDLPEDIVSFVSGMETPVFGVENSPSGLYTGDEDWFNINTRDLGYKMRNIYINKNLNLYKRTNDRLDFVKTNFSRNVIGNKIKDILCK